MVDDDDDYSDPDPHMCETCGGTGRVELASEEAGDSEDADIECPDCGGTGTW